MRVSVFMPAYQTSSLLEETILRIPDAFWNHIVHLYIINDGSADDTGEIAERLAKENFKIRVIHHEKNSGYGATVRDGIKVCLKEAADFTVCLHGDGQYAPELLPAMLKKAEHEKLDVLQGSRLAESGALAGGMPLYKWLAGRALCALENRVFKLKMTDYHSGYLIYRNSFLEQINFMKFGGNFEMDLELIATACARGFTVGEIPIPTRYAGEVSHLNPVAYGFRVLAVLTRFKRGYYA